MFNEINISFYILLLYSMDKKNRVYVNLYKKNEDNYYWEKDWLYFYLIPSRLEYQAQDIIYWVCVYKSKDKFDKRMDPDNKEKIEADIFWSIKERSSEKGIWYWWVLFDNVDKKAYFLNLYDNTLKWPDSKSNNDKTLTLTETEYRERPTPSTENDPF